MSQQISPPNAQRAEKYENISPAASKELLSDGSIVDPLSNVIISPPSEILRERYKSMAPRAAKWLLSDGSIIESVGSGTGGGEGGGPITAAQVSYSAQYPTVKAALDALLYVAPIATLSGGGTYEVGSTVTTVNLTWTLNKEVTSQSLNNGIGSLAVGLRAFTHSNQTITANRTYTLTVSDGTNTANASTTVAFSHKRYWGVSPNPSLTDAEIRGLNSEFSASRAQTRTLDATGGRYLYIIYPAAWGEAAFVLNGLGFNAMALTARNFINASGNTTLFNIYRSDTIQNGSAMVLGVN